MKLLELELTGTYKGLRDQSFNFRDCQGDVIALAGLNGSGKSQLLELICECFNWVERYNRKEFLVRDKWRDFMVNLTYQLTVDFDSLFKTSRLNKSEYKMLVEQHSYIFGNDIQSYDIYLRCIGNEMFCAIKKVNTNLIVRMNENFPVPLPNHILAYASGLNENLQLSFLRNDLKYYQAMKEKHYFTGLLNQGDMNDGLWQQSIDSMYEYSEQAKNNMGPITKRFNPAAKISIFNYDPINGLALGDTELPMGIFLDYDCNALMFASLAILRSEQRHNLFPEISYCHPKIIDLDYNLSEVPYADDAIQDLLQLIDIVGLTALEPFKLNVQIINRTPLPSLSGRITIDLSQPDVIDGLRDTYFNQPLTLFKKLYKIQLLGASQWSDKSKEKLANDNCFEHVKKPLKTHLPLAVSQLILENDEGKTIAFDDLSDGEAQLIQIIGAAHLFSAENTLMIFDEPETHLNPSWRTRFHQHLNKAIQPDAHPNIGESDGQVQAFISTHSPFLLSSLQKSDILRFKRNNDLIDMDQPTSETYGASFESIIKQFFELDSMISQTAVEDIKSHLERDDKQMVKQWIEENLGNSMEKAYLLRKLEQ